MATCLSPAVSSVVDQLVEVAADDVAARPSTLGTSGERAIGAEEDLGVVDDLAHVGRHGFEAVVADADDVDGGGQGVGCGAWEHGAAAESVMTARLNITRQAGAV